MARHFGIRRSPVRADHGDTGRAGESLTPKQVAARITRSTAKAATAALTPLTQRSSGALAMCILLAIVLVVSFLMEKAS